MSKHNRPTPQTGASQQPKATVRPQVAPIKTAPTVQNDTLVFGKENYKWMLIGLAIMAVGYLCMMGGAMPSPDKWDESIIYSPLRIIVAPFLILAGLGVEVYAIFKK